MGEKNIEQPMDNPERQEFDVEEFLIPREKNYKNPDMLSMEPQYLHTPDFNPELLTPLQYRRKISELAIRLGQEFRQKNPNPARKDPRIGVEIFKRIIGDIPEIHMPLVFYEDDPNQPYHLLEVAPQYQDVDFASLEANAVQAIELEGKNLKGKRDRTVLENDTLPTDDVSRIREINLRRK